MSIHVKYWEWTNAETCLEWLFNNHKDMAFYKSLHVWQESFHSLGNKTIAGSYRALTPEMLKGRVYSVRFINDSIGIIWYDQIFIDRIPNREYPDKTRCVTVRLPHN